MRVFSLKKQLKGFPIEAQCTVLDEGIHILLTGGCRTHIGAISYALPGRETETIQFPLHRDGIVSESWASLICQRLQVPVVVNCGIHYDHVNRDDINQIVETAEHLLEQTADALS